MTKLYKRGRPLQCQFYCDISSKFLISAFGSNAHITLRNETKPDINRGPMPPSGECN